MELTRDRALALLKDYNREPFHLQHAYTVEAVMRDFAREQGYVLRGLDYSPITGPEGNIEFLLWLAMEGESAWPAEEDGERAMKIALDAKAFHKTQDE